MRLPLFALLLLPTAALSEAPIVSLRTVPSNIVLTGGGATQQFHLLWLLSQPSHTLLTG